MEYGKTKIRQIVFVLLLMVMILAVGRTARADTKPDTVDFLVVLDCTGTMANSDPKYLSTAAVQMFVDILPIENARIGVLGFGPNWDNQVYVFHSNDSYSNASRVSLAYPIQDAGLDSERRNIKEIVDKLGTGREQKDTHTVIGTALLAAVDTLEDIGATNRSACIIFMSDGRITWDDTDNGTYAKVKDGIDKAAEHDWPIYSIELNYDDKNGLDKDWPGNVAREYMEKMGRETGGDIKVITSDVRDNNGLDGIVQTFGTIFSRFMDVVPQTGTIEIIDNKATKDFEIPDMVAETNIIITSPDLLKVDSVSVTNLKTGVERCFSENVSEEDFRVTINKGKYVMIKMIQPKAGDWRLTVYGQDGAKIYLQSISSQEMNLHLALVPDGSERSYGKKTQIKAAAYFRYNGKSYVSDTFYKDNPAYLEIIENNSRISLTPDSEGYSGEVTLEDSGTYTLQAVVESGAFRSGRKVSNSYTFMVVGEELTLGGMMEDIQLGVNEEAGPIDMGRCFVNQDGDRITYEASYDKSSGIKCDFDNDVMKIKAGEKSGNFLVTIYARDPDMKLPLSQRFYVKVINSAPVSKTIDEIKLSYNTPPIAMRVAGLFGFGLTGGEREINLDDYFEDPDKQMLYYTVTQIDTPVKVSISGNNNHLIHIEANKKGDVDISVTASDLNEEVHGTIHIAVKGWSGYYIMGAVLVIIVLSWFLFFRKRGIYGEWEISIDYYYEESVFLMQKEGGMKKHYPIKRMVMELTGDDSVDSPVKLCAGNNFSKKVWITNLKQANSVKYNGAEEGKVKKKYRLGEGDHISFYIGDTKVELRRKVK